MTVVDTPENDMPEVASRGECDFCGQRGERYRWVESVQSPTYRGLVDLWWALCARCYGLKTGVDIPDEKV